MSQKIISAPSDGERINFIGETVRMLVDSHASDGSMVQFEAFSPPGGGPPLHTHANDDESFFILEGNVKFSIDGKESVQGPGNFVFAPRGSLHTFCNLGPGRSRMLITCSPSGIETAFREAAKLEAAGLLNPQTIGEVFAKVGITFKGPPLNP